MATTDDSPILIGSDDDSEDDDGDVVLIKEEKPEDNDDVIFLSETAAPTSQRSKGDSRHPQDHSSLGLPALNRTLSISSNFRETLNIAESNEVSGISTPLDLSSKGRSTEESSVSDSTDIMGLENSDSGLDFSKTLISERDQACSTDDGVVSSTRSEDFVSPDLVPVSSSDTNSLQLPVLRSNSQDSSTPVVTSSSDIGLASNALNIDNDIHCATSFSSSTGVDHTGSHMSSGNQILGASASVPGSSFMISNLLGTNDRNPTSISDLPDLSCMSPTGGPSNGARNSPQTSGSSVLSSGPNAKPVDFAQCLEFLDSLSVPSSFNNDNTTSSDLVSVSSPNLVSVSSPTLVSVSSPDIWGGSGLSSSTGPVLRMPWSSQSSFATSNADPLVSSSFTVHHTKGDTASSLSNSHTLASSAATKSISCNSQPLCSSNFHRSPVQFKISAMKQLPPKKQARCFQQSPVSQPATTQGTPPVQTSWASDKCTCCKMSLVGMLLSRCVLGHATCGSCLEDKVKLVLTGKTKESIKCMESGCNSYYPMSELKHSLPSMVVEILEDKLDQEYVDYVANMILENACEDDKDKSGASTSKSENANKDQNKDSAKQSENSPGTSKEADNRKIDDIPPNWCKMESKTGCELFPLEPESAEYIEVALKFHNTMLFPQADIVRVYRLQNPILWRYYCVKKMEMIQDNDGLAVDEKQLFHGTNASVVDAICRKGFDWRVCGKHGTLYGQGSYFAVNASYSHQYTERPRMVARPRRPPMVVPVRSPIANISSVPSVGLIFQYLQQVSLPPPAHSGIAQAPVVIPSSTTLTPASSTFTQQAIPQSSAQTGLIGSPPVLQTTPQVAAPVISTSLLGNKLIARRARARRCVYSRPVTVDSLSEPPTIRKLFLAKSLVGKYTGGDSGLRKPPPLHPCTDPFGKCYDSCVDNIFNPTIFVIFDSAQTYPEYLIEYTYTD